MIRLFCSGSYKKKKVNKEVISVFSGKTES